MYVAPIGDGTQLPSEIYAHYLAYALSVNDPVAATVQSFAVASADPDSAYKGVNLLQVGDGLAVSDNDADRVIDGLDQCPLENALGFDIDSDGCIDDIDGLIELVQSFGFNNGLETSLEAKLNIASGNINQAINNLQAFKNAVEAHRGASISNDQADLLIAYADALLCTLDSSFEWCDA